jgi:hypothetical protein
MALLVAFIAVVAVPTVSASQGKAADAAVPVSLVTGVQGRATAYYEALKQRDAATAYRMETGFRDGSFTPLDFRRRHIDSGWVLLDYRILAAHVDGETAVVEADLVYKLPHLRKPYESRRQSHWVNLEGDWYHRTSPDTTPGQL